MLIKTLFLQISLRYSSPLRPVERSLRPRTQKSQEGPSPKNSITPRALFDFTPLDVEQFHPPPQTWNTHRLQAAVNITPGAFLESGRVAGEGGAPRPCRGAASPRPCGARPCPPWSPRRKQIVVCLLSCVALCCLCYFMFV